MITRRAAFSASHRYWLPELSEAENVRHFGACSLEPGHGHNYELIVAMGGGLDADGMVLNLSEVKHAIREQVTAQLDFRCLNQAWPEFDVSRPDGMLPTTEALALAIWRRLAPHLPLMGLRVYETNKLWADVLGDSMEAFLTIQTHFAAAHRLARPELSPEENDAIYGKCARPHGHGHNYLLEVTVRGAIDPRTGMVCDLAALQALVEALVVEPSITPSSTRTWPTSPAPCPRPRTSPCTSLICSALPSLASARPCTRCACRRAPTTPLRCSPRCLSWG